MVVEPERLADAAVGAAAGYAGVRMLAATYRLARGRDGLGRGDAKLLAAGGSFLGWQALPEVVLIAASGGLLFAATARLRGRALALSDRVPFGPFLACGIWAAWLGGQV